MELVEARQLIPDLEVVGDGDAWQLLCKTSSKEQGWMKSTKAMEVAQGDPSKLGGCLVQVATQLTDSSGSYAIAEAIVYVPGVRIVDDVNGGRRLA